MLRHPMAKVIIGFVLTGVLGITLTQYYSMKRQQEAPHQQQIEARKKAMSQLSSLNGGCVVVRKQGPTICYLSSGQLWYEAKEPLGPWSYTMSPPADVARLQFLRTS